MADTVTSPGSEAVATKGWLQANKWLLLRRSSQLFIPVVHSSDCTGCGKCEQACILEEAAINVMPINHERGKNQETYRLCSE